MSRDCFVQLPCFVALRESYSTKTTPPEPCDSGGVRWFSPYD
jgi:hypothetical protein